MRKLVVTLLLIMFIVILAMGGSLMGKKPVSMDVPCDATAVKVHISDFCGKSMWIDVLNSSAVEGILCPPCSKKPMQDCTMYPISWIGGTVVADPSYEHGFYFDPNTIVVASVTAEGYQTTICQIADKPGLFDGGLWYVVYTMDDIEEL
jgi:hypothetical protein